MRGRGSLAGVRSRGWNRQVITETGKGSSWRHGDWWQEEQASLKISTIITRQRVSGQCSWLYTGGDRSYGNKINNHFTNSKDTRSLWQGIQTITDYKPPPQACDDDTSLPDALNHFYSRFEMQNDTSAQKLPTPPNDQALCLSPADVRKTLSRINPRKAAGPDNIPGRVLKDCAEQLTDVLISSTPR